MGGSHREPRAGQQGLQPDLPSVPPQPILHPPNPGHSPTGPRLGPAAELCGGGWPTSWFTEGSLLTATWALFMGERTGP